MRANVMSMTQLDCGLMNLPPALVVRQLIFKWSQEITMSIEIRSED